MISRSMLSETVLHPTRAFLGGLHPTRKAVVATAWVASATMALVAAGGIMSSRAELTLEVDGVSQPITTWGGSVSSVLARAGVAVGEHDLIQPSLNTVAPDGGTIIVRTAKKYKLTVDGAPTTIWSTASSVQALLAGSTSLGSDVAVAADRRSVRKDMTKIVERLQNITIQADGQHTTVQASPEQHPDDIVAQAGVQLAPNDRLNVSAQPDGSMKINVDRVTRGYVDVDVPVEFSETTQESADLFKGESKITQAGVQGVATQKQWQESVNGTPVVSAVISESVTTAPTAQVRSNGTKEATPQALAIAGIDPKATLETTTDSAGNSITAYTAKLGTISTEDEVNAVIASIESATDRAKARAASAYGVSVASYAAGDPRGIGQELVVSFGWDISEFQCLDKLWTRESHWNPRAENVSSGAYGIPQSLPGSKMASEGDDWRTNPETQIKWGLKYIKGRYQSPCGAWAHSESVGWY